MIAVGVLVAIALLAGIWIGLYWTRPEPETEPLMNEESGEPREPSLWFER